MAKLKLPFELEKPSANEYVTQSSQIGHEGGSLADALAPLDNVEKQSTQSEEDALVFQTDGGTQVGIIDSTGADFSNLKRGGQQVARMSDLPTKDSSISDTPSSTNVPTSSAVAAYVSERTATKENTTSQEERAIFGNEAGTDTYAEISPDGIKAKAYYDASGNLIHFSSPSNVIVVAKSGGDYTTISAAVSHADDTENKAVTILIYPGIYEEEIDARTHKNLSFVGVNREKCIIKATDGRYGHDPLSYQGIGLIANLTIISTHDDYEYDASTAANIKNYCIHVDNQNSSARLSGVLTIQNCYLYCEQGSALGMGSRANLHVKVIGCEVVVDVPSWNVRKPYGGIYMHSYDAANIEGQELTLINNVVRTNTNTGITVAKGQDYRSPIKCYMYGNISYSSVNGHSANFIGTLDESSYGNSASSLNYSNS